MTVHIGTICDCACRSNCDSAAANVLRQHYQLPAFLPSAAESSKTDWIFMGSPGYGAHMHVGTLSLPQSALIYVGQNALIV